MASPSLITPESVVSIPRLLADRVAREPAGTYLELKAGLGGTWTCLLYTSPSPRD